MDAKLCACGHAMRSRGKQTLEMNGSGMSAITDHVEVELYVCHWCGRMAFFEPEEKRLARVRSRCSYLYPDELREFLAEDRPESERAIARGYLEAMEEDARQREEKENERRKARGDENRRGRKGFLSGLFGGDDDDTPKSGKIEPPEF